MNPNEMAEEAARHTDEIRFHTVWINLNPNMKKQVDL